MRTSKSEATKKSYLLAIHEFMRYLKIPNKDYAMLLAKSPEDIESDICSFIEDFSKNHAPASVSLYVAGIQKFYVKNRVILNWKDIRDNEPGDGRVVDDRPYNHSEIKQMIDSCDLRNKAIILLMSSSGVRVGAIPSLRYKDLEPIAIDSYNIFKVNVYAYPKTNKTYFTFVSPECAQAISQYLDWRRRFGERITDESPLFRVDFSVKTKEPKKVRPVTRNTIMKVINNLWCHLGFNQISLALETNPHRRNHIMQCHGFRKFFETNAYKAGMDHMYIRRLMGQKSGLEDAYLKLSQEELLEGDNRHVGYIDIIDQLTIDESNRLQRENQTLKEENTKYAHLHSRIENLYTKLGL